MRRRIIANLVLACCGVSVGACSSSDASDGATSGGAGGLGAESSGGAGGTSSHSGGSHATAGGANSTGSTAALATGGSATATTATSAGGSAGAPIGGNSSVGGSSVGAGGASATTSGTTATGGSTTAPDTTPVGIHGHLSVSGTNLVDEKGARVQLKGVSSQWLNLEKDGYALNAEALVWMRDNWKLTVFRAAMGAEEAGGEPGYTTNADAQAEMQRQVEIVINNAIKAGVYVIVDWHAHNALSQKDAAVAFFGDLSKRYGQYANLIFETFNEPLQVNWGTALKPYHQAVVEAIRNNDPDTHDNVVILGTPQWDQMPTDAAASPLEGTNLMYTVHFYSCTHNANSATPPPRGDGISHLQRAKNALSSGLPIFITEWGATKADGGVGGSAVCAAEADGWHEWMDANAIGWAAWKLDDCDKEVPPDTSCLLKVNAPLSGGWNDQLNGHGSYVVEKIKN